MTKKSIRFYTVRIRLPGPPAWWWLGVRTRFAARSEASAEQPFQTVGPDGVVRQQPAAYQRLLLARLDRYLEILKEAAAGILVRARATHMHRARRLGDVEQRLAEIRRSVPDGQEPPGLLSIAGPMMLAALVAMPLTWPFAESLGEDFFSTALLVIGVVILEVFAAERGGCALGSLIYNEPDTPMELSEKEVFGARLQLAIFGTAELALMGALAVARAAQGPLVLWLAIGAISAALGLFSGVLLERARPWRRLRRWERRRRRAVRARDAAAAVDDLVARRVAAMAVRLVKRVSELDDRASVVFARRWRRRHKQGVLPQVPTLGLPDEETVIAKMLEPLREIESAPDSGVRPPTRRREAIPHISHSRRINHESNF
jgi:hypothetical protein